MDPLVRRIALAAAIVLGASAGGYALGSFAVATESRAVPRTGAEELEAEAAMAPQAQERPAERDTAPRGYVCQGCDARTTAEAELADDFQPFDSAPLPPYRPPPAERGAPAADSPAGETDAPPAPANAVED